jgi:hypothetical protein
MLMSGPPTGYHGLQVSKKCQDLDGVEELQDFIASADNCMKEVTVAGYPSVYSQLVSYNANNCCSGGAAACDQYMQNPCVGSFRANTVIGGKMRCADVREMLGQGGRWAVNEAACKETFSMWGKEQVRGLVLEQMGPLCCDGQGHVCKDFFPQINPCLTQSDYQPDAKISDEIGVCSQGIAGLFEGNEVTKTECDKEVYHNGQNITKKAVLDKHPQCCSKNPTKCDDKGNSSSECAPRGGGLAAVLLACAAAASAC